MGISKTYAEDGDYVAAAGEAAGKLYGYGKSDVLFKPTKATNNPFRPTADDAMSYFVGADATSGDKVRVEYTFGYKRNDDGKVRIYLHHSSVPYKAAVTPLTEADVLECQAKWANAIKTISATYLKQGDYIAAAGEAAGELYGYGHTPVLFKPTKATKHPFRPTGEVAMSYFVGSKAMAMPEFDGEDAGFAINGGKGWSKVVFSNHQIDLNGPVALAMGSYDFTDATTGDIVTVEYTFGYKRNADGKLRIFLHHSSVPYVATKAAITEADVLKCQDAWASAIKSISKVYLDKGDYVEAA